MSRIGDIFNRLAAEMYLMAMPMGPELFAAANLVAKSKAAPAEVLDNVVDLNVVTKLDLDPDRVLSKAIGNLTEVVVIGFDKDGEEYFASSVSDGGSVLWHMERAKHKLMQIVDEQTADD